jgi:outer membrane lipoprotein SlyB
VKQKIIITICALTIFSSCATQNKSTALGGVVGAGTGAALGGIIDPGKKGEYRTRNVIVGSAIGGIAGAFAGSALFENGEKKKQVAYEDGQKNAKAAFAKQGNMPELKNPKVETQWIEGRAVGNRYIDGHFEYIIVEPTRWDVAR